MENDLEHPNHGWLVDYFGRRNEKKSKGPVLSMALKDVSSFECTT